LFLSLNIITNQLFKGVIVICEPETELKEKLRKAGISYRDVANRLGRRYSVVSSWLNGFSPLPVSARQQIEDMIVEAVKGKTEQ